MEDVSNDLPFARLQAALKRQPFDEKAWLAAHEKKGERSVNKEPSPEPVAESIPNVQENPAPEPGYKVTIIEPEPLVADQTDPPRSGTAEINPRKLSRSDKDFCNNVLDGLAGYTGLRALYQDVDPTVLLGNIVDFKSIDTKSCVKIQIPDDVIYLISKALPGIPSPTGFINVLVLQFLERYGSYMHEVGGVPRRRR